MGQGTTVVHMVRHGLVHDPHLIVYGRLPRFRLAGEGQAQAAAVADALKGKPIAAVFSSPLLRARQTARVILAEFPDLRLRISRLLHEVHVPFEGLPRDVAEARGWDMYTGSPSEYEQPAHILERTQKFVRMMRRLYSGREVVAITHGDVIAFYALWTSGQPVVPALKEIYFPAPASISSFIFAPDDPDDRPAYRYHVPY